jgi:hypothetical protein
VEGSDAGCLATARDVCAGECDGPARPGYAARGVAHASDGRKTGLSMQVQPDTVISRALRRDRAAVVASCIGESRWNPASDS